MDIRNFFSPSVKKTDPVLRKRKVYVIASDDEDEVTNTVKKVVVSDSDDDNICQQRNRNKSPIKDVNSKQSTKSKPSSQNKKSKVSRKLQPISALDFFSKSPVINSRKPESQKVKVHKNPDLHFERTLEQLDKKKPSLSNDTEKDIIQLSDDDDFEKTLQQLDNQSAETHKVEQINSKSILVDKNKKVGGKIASKLASKIKEKSNSKSSPRKRLQDRQNIPAVTNETANIENKTSLKNKNDDSKNESIKESSKKSKDYSKSKKKKGSNLVMEVVPNKEKRKSTESTIDENANSCNKKTKLSNVDDEKLTPEADEKKKQNKFSYIKYLQRSGPKNPGGKPLPEGTPDCLNGLTFVTTGVLETIDRDDVVELIKTHGGRVTTSLSRNTSYLVVGEDAGESKMAKAKQLNTKLMTEDELFELINKSKPSEKVISTPINKEKSLKRFAKTAEQSPDLFSPVSFSGKLSTLSSPISEKIQFSSPATPSNKSSPFYGSSQVLSQLSSPSLSRSDSQSTQPLCTQEITSRPHENMMWVDKYKPVTLKNIIGQQGDMSCAKKLINWLKNWHANNSGEKKTGKAGSWSKDGSSNKAALLSGPPGVGKTTTANIVCKELGLDVVELNASDTRSKRRLTEEVSELLCNQSLAALATGTGKAPTRQKVLLMDEVDGMAGNEDRGGVQELIALIKSSKVPIICMCNDRNHQKIRSLSNYCFDLRFNKPRLDQIRGAMLTVCFREGIKIKADALDQIITNSNYDIRQTLHHLSMWCADSKILNSDEVDKGSKMNKKEFKLGPWEVCKKVFTEDEKMKSIHDRVSLFFHDYSIGPLFVQDTYPKVEPASINKFKNKTKTYTKKLTRLLSQTANSICDSDIIDQNIRKNQNWGLLPTMALFSSVVPGYFMRTKSFVPADFPKWLGNNSRRNKFDRLSQEIHTHMRLRISGTKQDVILDYSPALRDAIVTPLIQNGSSGVHDSVSTMGAYDLLREDLEAINELSSWSNKKDKMSMVDSKVKAAFTRAFNKECHMTPFSSSGVKKASQKSVANDVADDDAIDAENENSDEDISKDTMIKAGKLSQSKGGKAKGQSKSSSKSKGKK